MRFMIIRKADPETEAGVMPGPELLQAMGRYNQELMAAGVMLDGAGLRPTSTGTRVKLERGMFTVTDGPFTEAKELVAGFSIWSVASKAEALAWLAKWPPEDGHGEARLELRELYEVSDFGGAPDDAPASAAPARKPGTTRFLVMLQSNAFTESGAVTGERAQATVAAMGELMDELARSGAVLGGAGLKPSAKAARVHFTGGGKHAVLDGPFAETKELIAGTTTIQGSKADALDFAKRWLEIHVGGLGLDSGAIEIRPLYEAEDFGG